MKILMVASEATPFCKTGGLADVIGALPPALQHLGEEVAVVVPGYRANQYSTAPQEVYRNFFVPLGTGYMVDIYRTVERDVPFYFVHCPPLFDRDGFYGSGTTDYPDNHIRFAVFSFAALGVIRHLFRPEVVHCHDWQAALTPVYMRHTFAGDPAFLGMKVLFTIHNLGYQGLFPRSALAEIGLGLDVFTPAIMEFFGQVNLLKGAIAFSDAVSTVSRGYAREIQTKELGFGLDGFLKARADRLSGIVNGVDYLEWSPEHDHYIAEPYSAVDLAGKAAAKKALLEDFGLPATNADKPVVGMVSRFVDQKGFDLIAEIAPELGGLDMCLVALGSGDPHFEAMMRDLAAAHPEKFAVHIGYDNALAHRIEAGADIFLMPSRYEPCGLNQIYSLRYGTVPVVRATGGLDDTIDEETGFKFHEYTGAALLTALQAALDAFGDRESWLKMVRRGMAKDFSWTSSAGEYAALYGQLRSARDESFRSIFASI